ncbi:hypothetical protein FOL47_011370 [Perkinsus chesapeaki]|uniref:DDE Tnp4 domain-containing protein n=1 Tax=Perkinsus chesapeaki TaxID=330153 RepID=A0A7J6MP96_PERCH|nr:hypothetical protein FOL47_011370 [Perkinsus chesapeaki]
MCPLYIRIPSGEDLQRSVDCFRQLSGMMDVWAVLDGTHVKVHPPSQLEGAFVNRNHEHSLNCQVVCTHYLENIVLTVDQQEFNNRQRRARTVFERCIGVLKIKFRSLKDFRIRGPRQTGANSMELTANAIRRTCPNSIRACVALRNFLIVDRAEQVEDVDSDLGDSSPSSG